MNFFFRKCIPFFLLFFYLSLTVFAQKPIIDTSIIGKWPFVEFAVISNNGAYVSYWQENGSLKPSQLIIQNMNNGRKLTYEEAWSCHFSQDNQKAIFQIKD